MASLNMCSVLLLLFITSGVVIASDDVDQIIKANNCETRMGFHCVMEVFTSIFKTGTVTDKCCGELLVLGKVCHAALVKKSLENPLFKELKPSTIVAKSIQTWNHCASVMSNSISPSA